jgi:hypothetical protein
MRYRRDAGALLLAGEASVSVRVGRSVSSRRSLIEPDAHISRIRLSDQTHAFAYAALQRTLAWFDKYTR